MYVTVTDQVSNAEAPPVVHKETGSSEANLITGKPKNKPNQVPKKQVKPVCQLQKILKFKLLSEAQTNWTIEQSNMKPD